MSASRLGARALPASLRLRTNRPAGAARSCAASASSIKPKGNKRKLEDINSLMVVIFNTYSKNGRGSLGFYGFHLLEQGPVEGPDDLSPVQNLIFGLWAYKRGGKVVTEYDGGDEPKANSTRARELHDWALARVRSEALSLKLPQAYFFDDAGKLSECPARDFLENRMPAVLAAAPVLSTSEELYKRVALDPGVGGLPLFCTRCDPPHPMGC